MLPCPRGNTRCPRVKVIRFRRAAPRSKTVCAPDPIRHTPLSGRACHSVPAWRPLDSHVNPSDTIRDRQSAPTVASFPTLLPITFPWTFQAELEGRQVCPRSGSGTLFHETGVAGSTVPKATYRLPLLGSQCPLKRSAIHVRHGSP